MPFPEKPRVIYEKNPLDQVVCQLRFPPILKIEKGVPADFQDRIRSDFPDFHEKKETALPLSQGQSTEMSIDQFRRMTTSEVKNFEFLSEDELWKVNLTRTFLALSTKKYQRWEEFIAKLKGPLSALNDIYEPANFSRVGLRYIDIIRRSVLGLDNVDWSELLKPYVLGFLNNTEVREHVESYLAQYEIRLADGSSIAKIVMGLAEDTKTKEVCFKIDTDFFDARKTDCESAVEKLNYFHIRASKLIQWLIENKLHEAFGPKAL